MKKHIAVTVILLLIFTLVLAGFLWHRNQTEDFSKNNFSGSTEQTGQENGQDTETASGLDTEGNTAAGQNLNEENGQYATEQTSETEDSAQAVSMIFTGDVLIAYSFVPNYDSAGISGVLGDGILTELKGADITMVNEEFPFTSRGTAAEDKQYTFRADPSYVSALQEMGVDIVTIANNHTLDYGKEGLTDTFSTLDKASILYAGAGESAERAKAVQTIEVNGRKIGFLAASRVIPVESWNVDNSTPGIFTTYDGTALCDAVTEAKKTCDYVVVFVHWGIENEEYPQDYQRSLAKQYIDAGADLVIGSHPHCLQGIEYYKGKPIYYSLGNFIFRAEMERSMAVKVTLEPNGQVECRLLPVAAQGGCTSEMEEAKIPGFYQYMEGISDGITISSDGIVTEE